MNEIISLTLSHAAVAFIAGVIGFLWGAGYAASRSVLLAKQLDFMTGYLGVLRQRIARFK